jgi:toxin FitB
VAARYQHPAFVATRPLDLLYISSATIAEIRFGIELVSDANRRAELNDWLAHQGAADV